jgi:hypothetical protein
MGRIPSSLSAEKKLGKGKPLERSGGDARVFSPAERPCRMISRQLRPLGKRSCAPSSYWPWLSRLISFFYQRLGSSVSGIAGFLPMPQIHPLADWSIT